MLWAAEHGWIYRAESSVSIGDGNLDLQSRDFDALLSLLEDAGDADDLTPAFQFMRRGGRDCLKVQNWVGLIRTTHGAQIEILPKISRKDDPRACRELLIKMLVHLEDPPFREAPVAQLEAHEMPLMEVLFRYFLDQVTEVVRRGIARTYVQREDNLVFLRGKLLLSEHLRYNVANGARMYCEFDDYDTNRPVNRLIRGALDIVRASSTDSENQRLGAELSYWFDSVPPTTDPRQDFSRMQRDRMIRHYDLALPPCRMILEHLNPLTKSGEREALSMLFPMERVFEDYVAAKLVSQFPQWRIRTQVGGKSLVESHGGRRMFALRPDLMLSRGRTRIIADTKWKLINAGDRSNKYGISQADIYQLFAYAKRYLPDQESPRQLLLIYPNTSQFEQPLEPFWYESEQEVLWVVPFDLERGVMVTPPGVFS